MTTIEDRLREQLPELADALTRLDDTVDVGRSDRSGEVRHAATRRSWRWQVVAAAATIAAVVGGLIVLDRGRDGDAPAPAALPPVGAGSWRVMAAAPISTRAHAATAWTGSEAVFWAGSSLTRNFAHTDGAAYDPSTDTWRAIPVPGWGHPGMTSAWFEGELYVLAKGGGTRYDPLDGTWADLPEVEGMYLAATVATDDAVWGLGPATQAFAGQADLAIVRYLPATDEWEHASTFEGTDEQAPIVAGLTGLEADLAWTGDEIVVWFGADGGIAFDPDTDAWRVVDPPRRGGVEIVHGRLVATDVGTVLLAGLGDGDARPERAALAVMTDAGWEWRGEPFRVGVDAATVAAAGEWLAVFTPGNPPLTVHVPSGEVVRHGDVALDDVEAPNTVWTGTELIVWGGGSDSASTAGDAAADGVIWTPRSN